MLLILSDVWHCCRYYYYYFILDTHIAINIYHWYDNAVFFFYTIVVLGETPCVPT